MASRKQSSTVEVEKEERQVKKVKKDKKEEEEKNEENKTIAFDKEKDRQDLISRYASSIQKNADSEEVIEAVDEYYKAMKVKKHLKDFDATQASFGGPIDDIWHLHVLNTLSYRKFCGNKFIHHDPNGGNDPLARQTRYATFLDTYKKLFDVEAPTKFFTPLPSLIEVNAKEEMAKVEDKKEEEDIRGLSINIQSAMTARFQIKILPETSIKRVKEIIEKKRGYESSHQRLIFAGKELKDDQTCASIQLEEGHTLSCCLNALENVEKYDSSCKTILYQQMDSSLSSLQVLPSTTVSRMKELIERKSGIPVDQQRLVFAGKQLQDSETFASTRMHEECTIHVALSVHGC